MIFWAFSGQAPHSLPSSGMRRQICVYDRIKIRVHYQKIIAFSLDDFHNGSISIPSITTGDKRALCGGN